MKISKIIQESNDMREVMKIIDFDIKDNEDIMLPKIVVFL